MKPEVKEEIKERLTNILNSESESQRLSSFNDFKGFRQTEKSMLIEEPLVIENSPEIEPEQV